MKYLPLFILFCLGTTVVAAQSFYLKATVGYNTPLSGTQHIQLSGFPYSGSTIPVRTDYSFDVAKASYNAGNNLQLTGGYWFSGNIGAALSISACLTNKRYTYSTAMDIYPEGSITHITQYAQVPLLITPSLAIRTTASGFTGYIMAGAALPVHRRIYTESETWRNDTLLFSDKTKLTTGFSLGLSGTAGIKYALDDRLSLCAELHVLALSVYTRRSELVASRAYGQDIMYARSAYERVTEYKKDFDPAYPYDENQPRQMPRYAVPFSSIGVQLGIWYAF